MNSIQDAIDNLNQAINELIARRAAAKALGEAIGSALGTSVGIWRSSAQIDCMNLLEIAGWSESVSAYVASSGSGG